VVDSFYALMIQRKNFRKLVFILVVAVFMAFAVNPKPFPSSDLSVIGPLWNWLQDQRIHLGLDLQGGTQLDYEIDLREARARNADDNPDNDVDLDELIEGVKEVIVRRVNSLGVAEPNIFLADIGTEKHIIVELPGVDDIDEAKAKVGKVVSLEFKTEKLEVSEAEQNELQQRAEDLLVTLIGKRESNLEEVVEDVLESGRVEIREEDSVFADQLPTEISNVIDDLPLGDFYPEVVTANEGYIYRDGGLQPQQGLNLLRLREVRTLLRKVPVHAEDFGTVAKEFNTYAATEEFSRLKEIDSTYRSVVEGMEKGEVSSVLELDEEFVLLKVDDVLEPTDEEWSVRASHILFKTQAEQEQEVTKPLKKIEDDATAEEREQLLQENEEIRTENAAVAERNEGIAEANALIVTANAAKKAQAEEILAQVTKDPGRFEDLAAEYSEDTSSGSAGDLGYFGPGKMVAPFEEAVRALTIGEIRGDIVESEFGYHIIRLDDERKPSETLYRVSTVSFTDKDRADNVLKRVREEKAYTLDRVWFSTTPNPWEDTELDGRYFKRADVAYDQTTYRPFVSISFDSKGADLFEEITAANVGKPVAIFVGGELISAPRVQQAIAGGQAQITLGITDVQQALQEANELARNLNAGAIPAPLKKPNELNIGASLGADALQKSLKAGMIGLVLVAFFIILFYRFLGLIAVFSLCLYGIFLLFFIESTIPPSLSYLLAGVGWFVLAYQLLQSRFDSWSKLLYIILSMFGIFFIGNVMSNPIVLTLAGVAGVVLSIGMAVDANILIFERIKEEFALGRSFLSAVETGFDRAWTSILDSNVSTLITCGILFYFGSSIIRGFAFNLALGVVISMFTAVTVSRTLLLLFSGTRIEKMKWLWKRK
jgi:protein-export membrane protein SecD